MVEIDVSVGMSFNNAAIFLWVQAYAEFVYLRRGPSMVDSGSYQA
jgi:hypothetical protein